MLAHRDGGNKGPLVLGATGKIIHPITIRVGVVYFDCAANVLMGVSLYHSMVDLLVQQRCCRLLVKITALLAH